MKMVGFTAFLGILVLSVAPSGAAPGPAADIVISRSIDLSAQTQIRRRPRIRVVPAPQPQPRAWTYPRPGEYSYPGPNAVRECSFRLVQEDRPSGTVVVPAQHCWWRPG